jgi:hypothetical protein
MSVRNIRLLVVLGALCAGSFVAAASAAGTSSGPQPVADSSLKALSLVEGGATVLPTTRTVAHWFGTSPNPNDGITYGYNMVGADPNNCSGSACDVTVEADITPIIVHIDGLTFDGTGVVNATLASPEFATNDFGSTTAATKTDSTKGPGGALSQGDAGLQLQLQDATMRAQFNKTGGSPYHLRLNPHVLPAVTIDVPNNQGGVLISGRGVLGASVDIGWWSSQINNLETQADPTHLPIYLTNNVFLHLGKNGDITNCCVIGYHGTKATGLGGGGTNSSGNAPVQTFAWASYIQPGFYARSGGGVNWALQDIHAISHEIAEWADDPFGNNTVEPWLTPTAPQYGCTSVLETGDPVVGIGFSMGTNTFFQGANPNGSASSADGTYHPEDEVLLPWFMRTAPNTVSEPTQAPSTNIGRYTLMGDLNPFPGFRQPATGC